MIVEYLETLLLETPDDRTIIWVIEEDKFKEKKQLLHKLSNKINIIKTTIGTKNGLNYFVYKKINKLKNNLDILVVDITKNKNQKVCYSKLEQIKDGILNSSNSSNSSNPIIFNPFHIIVFSTIKPDIDKFGINRLKIYKIENDNIVEY